MLKRWGERSPQMANPRIELARLYEEFGDKESAVRQLTDALQLEAANTRAWAALGRLRESQGQMAQALADYQQAYNLNQYQPGVAARIASLQQSLGVLPGTQRPTQLVNTPQSLNR